MLTKSEFEIRTAAGWKAGLGSLIKKENKKWWAPKRVAVHAVIWSSILIGLMSMIMFVIPNLPSPDDQSLLPGDPAIEAVKAFFGVGSVALALGAVILMQNEIIEEIQTGTANWVLSNPVTRRAFVISKLVPSTTFALVIFVGLPSLLAYLVISRNAPGTLEMGRFLGAVGLQFVNVLFYLALTLLLGCFTTNRSIVLGATLASALGGQLLASFIPPLALITPWMFSNIFSAILFEVELPIQLLLPIISSIMWSVLFAVGAVRKFESLEL